MKLITYFLPKTKALWAGQISAGQTNDYPPYWPRTFWPDPNWPGPNWPRPKLVPIQIGPITNWISPKLAPSQIGSGSKLAPGPNWSHPQIGPNPKFTPSLNDIFIKTFKRTRKGSSTQIFSRPLGFLATEL